MGYKRESVSASPHAMWGTRERVSPRLRVSACHVGDKRESVSASPRRRMACGVQETECLRVSASAHGMWVTRQTVSPRLRVGAWHVGDNRESVSASPRRRMQCGLHVTYKWTMHINLQCKSS